MPVTICLKHCEITEQNGVLMCEHTYIPLILEVNGILFSVPNKRLHELIINEPGKIISEQQHLFFSPYFPVPPKVRHIKWRDFLLQREKIACCCELNVLNLGGWLMQSTSFRAA